MDTKNLKPDVGGGVNRGPESHPARGRKTPGVGGAGPGAANRAHTGAKDQN